MEAGAGLAAISVVDPGFMVDSVDRGALNQPHNPDQPQKEAH